MSIAYEIDVVILSLNRGEYTLEAVKSVKRQVGVITKIWLVDQGSDPSTLKLLRKHATQDQQVSLVELKTNRGVAGGRNIGLELGQAEFIFSLDNDAEINEDDTLLHVVERFLSEPNLAVIAIRIDNYFTRKLDYSSWAYPRYLLKEPIQEFKCTRFAGGSCCIRRSAFAETRGYDEKLFFYWEELDLSYQFIENGYHIVYDPSRSILHKVSAETRIRWKDNRFYFLVKNALYLEWKYYNNFPRFIILAVGYLVKGIYNNVILQSIRGIRDSLRMIAQLPKEEKYFLSDQAKQYIIKHDLKYRGNMIRRIKSEVIEKLPR